MLKKICYIFIIFSYLIISFILIYFNHINPNYEGPLPIILSIIVIIIWLVVFIVLSKTKDKTIIKNKDIIEEWLLAISLLPIFILLSPLILVIIVFEISDAIKNRFKLKCKTLLNIGFRLSKVKKGKNVMYFLNKENISIRITPNIRYEISLDSGNNYVDIIESKICSFNVRREIEYLLSEYKRCDYRDKDIYEPTVPILNIIAKNIK